MTLLASVLRKILHANDDRYVGYVNYYPLRLTLDLTIDITDEELEAMSTVDVRKHDTILPTGLTAPRPPRSRKVER